MRLAPNTKKAAIDFAKAIIKQMKTANPSFKENIDSVDDGLMDEAMNTFYYALQGIYLK